jgi:hypothetical protein
MSDPTRVEAPQTGEREGTMNARRIRTSLVFCLLITIAACTLSVAQSSPPWDWGPLLGVVGEDHVSIVWKTSRSVGFDLHYGLAQVYDATGTWDETLVFDQHDGVAEIWLQDLVPGSTYRYQLVCYEGDAVYPTEVGSFTTTASDARSLSFVTYGATRSFPDRHRLVADAIAGEATLDIIFHAGGLVEEPTAERFDNFFWAIGDLARSRSYLPIIGGRDAENDLYYDYFSLPKGGGENDEEWWSLDVAGIHFVGLDSTLTGTGDEAAMREQTAWLAQDLAEAAGKIIIVLSHNPLYSASYPSGKNDALGAAWESLFVTSGVDIVFSSAIHCYEHIYRYGIHHVITGGGGALVESPDAAVSGTVFRRYRMLHYVRGTLADNRLLIEAIPVASVGEDDTITLSSSGRSIDSFVIENLP